MKRVFLFVVTNLAVIAVLGVTLHLFGVQGMLDERGVGIDVVDIEPKNGVALHIWEGHVEVASITFDDISQAQEGFLSEVLPVEGIADDCDPSDGEG